MEKRARDLLGRLIAVTVLVIVALFAAAMPLMMSAMIFDSGATAQAWTVFLGVWATPLVMISGLVYAWIGLGRGSYRATRTGLIVTIVPLVLIAALVVWIGIHILMG